MQQATFTWLVLPTPQDSQYFGPVPVIHNLRPAPANVHDQPLPDFVALNDPVENSDDLPPPILDRAVVVDTYHTAQRPRGTWEEFRARMEEGLRKRKEKESDKDKQSREAMEQNAKKHGYSKKTTIFCWEEDEVEEGFYRRTKIDRCDIDKYWSLCTTNQRFFWSHRKEWDLVPNLVCDSPGERDETPFDESDMEDEPYNFLYKSAPPQKPDDQFDEPPSRVVSILLFFAYSGFVFWLYLSKGLTRFGEHHFVSALPGIL